MARVTVAINVYNGMPYLRAALQSVLDQTISDIEILIVNDGSTDGSREYLETVNDPRIRIIDQPNGGASVASNTAIQHCHTKYLARMDADDIAMPDRIKLQLAFLEANPDVGMIGGQTANLGTRSVGRSIKLPCDHDEIWKTIVSGHHAMAHPTLMMRTDLIKQVGGYWKHRLADDDIDMIMRMGEVARLANLDQVILHYRLRRDSLCGLDMRGIRFSCEYAIELGRRRRANLQAISPEEFREQLRLQPWPTRLLKSLDTHALKQYRIATEEIYGESRFFGRARLVWAAACSPQRTAKRLKRILRTSEKPARTTDEEYSTTQPRSTAQQEIPA